MTLCRLDCDSTECSYINLRRGLGSTRRAEASSARRPSDEGNENPKNKRFYELRRFSGTSIAALIGLKRKVPPLLMKNILRVLHLEDDPDYSDLVRCMLESEGIKTEIVLVNNRADFEAALALESFDLILADYSLTDYNGIQALQRARQN